MRAFTLFEVTTIIIVVGILTLIALPRLAPNARNLSGATDILRTHLRYAQMCAQSYGQRFGMQSTNSIGYIMFEGAPDTLASLPGYPNSYTLKDSITISNFLVSFNEAGIPCSDPKGDAPLTQDIIITLRDGVETETIRICPETGFVS